MTAPRGPVMEIYRTLYGAFGPQHWWPGETPLEVIAGAILTQNTAWGNVEKAIENLRRAGLLSAAGLRRATGRRLAALVRPAGYFNQKAGRLKAFIAHLDRAHGGSLARMGRVPAAALREELLAVRGIGPETADSILLYAFGKRAFVVDAYTVRILGRHGLIRAGASYGEVRRFLEERVPARARLYNEFHALLVRAGKEFCRTRPRCDGCPLRPVLARPPGGG
ncbi:MAG: endonuclease III domain-containing protein [bacterium]|nr:endonuclease III domain-containing protein [bacterium]